MAPTITTQNHTLIENQEVSFGTITNPAGFDFIDVFVDASGNPDADEAVAEWRLYEIVGGLPVLVATAPGGGKTPSVLDWGTGSVPAPNPRATSLGPFSPAEGAGFTFELRAFFGNPFGQPPPNMTASLVGYDEFDVAPNAVSPASNQQIPTNFSEVTFATLAGYAQFADAVVSQSFDVPVRFTLYAQAGVGGVVAEVAAVTLQSADGIARIFGSPVRLPGATAYILRARFDSNLLQRPPSGPVVVSAGLATHSQSVSVGGVVNLVGNDNGPSNANRFLSLAVPSNDADVVIPEVGPVPGDGWWNVPFSGLTGPHQALLPAAPTPGEVVVLTDLDMSLAAQSFNANGNGNNVEGVPSFSMNNAYPGPNGSICLMFVVNPTTGVGEWVIFADYAPNVMAPPSPMVMGAIIYKPGVPSAGDHVATWPEVQTFVTATDGKCIVYVDDSVVSPALVPGATGITNLFGRTEFRPWVEDSLVSTILQVEPGATLDNLYALNGMELRLNAQNATPSLDFSQAPNGGFFYLLNEATLSNAATATQPGIVLAANRGLGIQLQEQSLINLNAPAVPLIHLVAATSSLSVVGISAGPFPQSIPVGFVDGLGGLSLIYARRHGERFPAPWVPPAQPGLPGGYQAIFSDADPQHIEAVVYKPGTPSSGEHVETWAEVQKVIAAAASTGKCIVYVDDSLTAGAGALVPGASGVTDGFGRLEIRPYRQDGNGTFLIVEDGATLKGLYRIAGWIGLFADTQGAVPAFDWDYSAGGGGAAAIPTFFIEEEATIGNTATATQPAVVVPGGNGLAWNFDSRGGIALFAPGAVFLVQLTAAPNTIFAVHAESGQICEGGSFANVATGGAGTTIIFQFDSSTLSLSPVTPNLVAGTLIREQTDTHAVEMTFLASANNVLAALQTPTMTTLRALPDQGLLPVQIEGFGGVGGGAGGQAGAPAGSPGSGAGASGGCQYQTGSFLFDLSHRLDVVVGPAGVAGNGGISPSGFGTDGTDGGPSYALDFTSNIVLAALNGSSGGTAAVAGPPNGGKGGATYPNAHIPHSAADALTAGAGFIASGGAGGAIGGDGGAGQNSLLSFNHPFGAVNVWTGGAGGSGAAGGGGGGGGGQGPFDNGAAGGASGDPAGAGTASSANSGAGAGGGGGGITLDGGPGGAGSLGRVKLKFAVP